jgi:hypothetical protein
MLLVLVLIFWHYSLSYAAPRDNSKVCFRADVGGGGASYFGSLGLAGKIDLFVQKGRFLLQPR